MEIDEVVQNNADKRLERIYQNEELDSKYGFVKHKSPAEKIGWLVNFQPSEMIDDLKRFVSAVDYYFIGEDNQKFKATVPYNPYFYVGTKEGTERDVLAFLSRKYSGKVAKLEIMEKEDLDLKNHLIGLKQQYIKLIFLNVDELIKVRREILNFVKRNKELNMKNSYETNFVDDSLIKKADQLENIIDIREYDVPYHVRVSIDLKMNVGLWYSVKGQGNDTPIIQPRPDLVDRPDPVILAYDIETTKLPLKFPDSSIDQIMMISYMIDGKGFLITNREIVSEDVEDFDFTPKPEFPGHFIIFNEPDEKAVIRRFFEHIIEVQPQVISTPFVDARAKFHEINMFKEIGFYKDGQDEYQSRACIHMDCYKWVKRDSYLPIGSQGLKAVAKAKLNYNPIELDPEEMCKLAVEQPQVLSNYSVSDAVATYYLYMKYVHPFIFALCTIIPMEPDSVLRKGSGTLCEMLLMVQAYQVNIVYPNKQETVLNKLTSDGFVIDSETYVGASVEALESGVFRADIPAKFKLSSETLQSLIDDVRRTMQRAIEIEEKVPLSMVVNFDDVCNEIIEKLSKLRDCPNRLENPTIYHLDVGAMYPNIILTNRLQPSAIVDESDCSACDFNKPGEICQRKMKWIWRSEYMPATKNEFQRIQQQLENERFPVAKPGTGYRAFHELSLEEQAEIEKKRLQDYCRKAYKKIHVTREELRETTVCQRENSFYVDTVRAFRDRRYEFKNLHKIWKKKLATAQESKDAMEIKKCNSMVILYDSLQLAHKCILNSFYGYVMRRGARWYSMEMAGIVCYTGSTIITRAKELIEKIGRPLELDTDGIWCILPATFPENFVVKTTDPKKKITISYPCSMLNLLVKDYYTNDQYHELVDPKLLKYDVRSENSVFFEVDGPYLAMILPAAKEEGKRLKKRYAVFNFDGSLAELKGFEVKRNGELQLIKIFQSSVFEAFLKGKSIEECYDSVAKIANYWLDILYTKAENMPDYELFELIAEKKTMSKALEEYGGQKSTSISTAKRLAEFLGDEMVKDKGLNCKYIISKKPEGAPVAERAIPIAIFQAEPSVCKHYLKKWLKAQSNAELEVRNFLDWEYYIERLNGCIQKIITIPAALQGVVNPVLRVPHPDWLYKRLSERNSTLKQKKIDDIFSFRPKPALTESEIVDIEDLSSSNKNKSKPIVVTQKTKSPDGRIQSSKRKQPDVTAKKPKFNWREVLGEPPKLGQTSKELRTWITFHKRKWILQIDFRRQLKKAESEQNGNDFFKMPNVKRTITDFVGKSNNSRMQRPWQIIQVTETNSTGLFKIWLLSDNDLYVVNINMMRIFYVNQIKPMEKESSLCRKTNKHLPRSQIVYNLYEYSIPENVFQKHQNDIMNEFSNSNVEGVYELNVPLMFRILMQLGCDYDTFEINDLEPQNNVEYLTNNFPKTIFLFVHNNSTKMIIGIFLPTTNTAQVLILDSVKTNNMPNLSSLLNSEREKRLNCGIGEEFLPNASQKFEIKIEINEAKVYKTLDKIFSAYKDEKRGSTIILLQSNVEELELKENVPRLEDFPIIKFNIAEKAGLFKVLDWQKVAAKHMIGHFMNSQTILANMIEQSRYYQIPVGNLPQDAPSYACDLFYARHLAKNNYVLWCSPTSIPDLGGKQYDDYRLIQNNDESGTNSICVQINNSGFYQNICLEIEITSLSISALLQLTKINEFDGASSVNFSVAPQISLEQMISGDMGTAIFSSCYDEAALSLPVLKIMRTMVQYWLKDIAMFGNAFADMQIIHFYRWLQSPSSLLYDPVIKRTLQGYMKKLCILLINELKKLGGHIIYADLSRIIIGTNKFTVDDGLNQLNYILNNIQNKDLFSTVHIETSKVWTLLIWLDSANYGGIKYVNNPEDEENKEEIEMNWKMSTFLPQIVQENFLALVAGYLGSINENLKVYVERLGNKTSNSEPHDMTLPKFSQELVSGELTEQLMRLTQKIYKKLTDEDIPEQLGARYKLRCPALEFVKYVCQILALDKNISNQVIKLKKDLLTIINVREFSDEAQFVDPSLSFMVPQIICLKCNHCRDIDLCRDPCSNLNEADQSKQIGWYCANCGEYYDLRLIEYNLIEALHSKIMHYLTQDIKCSKCNEVRAGFLQDYCECTGAYENLISNSEASYLVKSLISFTSQFLSIGFLDT
ncbi:DNA polymerase epsilon catalytic subunit A [Brachionus plicatilis]|uniref:DNA polymerase epsilon catalytic subunit n=1 Tax=Brachionus plicatilis TaxID=10195 RepID=A0A3M7QHW7_BRAPC|nr:DNA polymerase epsilon catalytic subunit A [Brachionus plicatilis]